MKCLETLDRTSLGGTLLGSGRHSSTMITYDGLCEVGGVCVWLETFTGIGGIL
jgi:hypothetical protein